MSFEQILSTVWRRRRLFGLAFLACLAVVVVVTFALPKTYKATATVYVGANSEVNKALAFDTTLGEQLTRTYATLAGNPNVADEARQKMPYGFTRDELLSKMSFTPVERTQLLEISAEGDSPEQAQTIANTYTDTFVARNDVALAQGATQAKITVSEPASKPTSPAKPNPPLYIGLGAFLSIFVALGVVLLRDRLEDRLEIDPDDNSVLGHQVIGRIPDGNWARSDFRPQLDDAFELMKTNLDFGAGTRSQVTLVTSAAADEGKSSIALGLASTFFAHGETVVLLEADLRRPGIAAVRTGVPVKRASVGLTNYLAGQAERREIVNPYGKDRGMDVIWSGPLPEKPSALLQSPRFARLVAALSSDYDRVIIDSPPAALGADVSMLAAVADTTVLVIDAQRPKRSLAQAAVSQLETVQATALLIALNRMRRTGLASAGYYPYRTEDTVSNSDGKSKSRRRRGAGV
ncbi:MAG: polysaccharide biosynthesis tyrosine autokinase [Solirubrobacterales bacterium]